MKALFKIIAVAVLFLGAVCCSGGGPKIIKTEEINKKWENEPRIRALCKDSTVFEFKLLKDNPLEVMLVELVRENTEGVVVIPEEVTSNNVT